MKQDTPLATQELRTRALVDQDYTNMAALLGDRLFKVGLLEIEMEAISKRMTELAKEPVSPPSNEQPDALEPAPMDYETSVQKHKEREHLLDVLLNGEKQEPAIASE